MPFIRVSTTLTISSLATAGPILDGNVTRMWRRLAKRHGERDGGMNPILGTLWRRPASSAAIGLLFAAGVSVATVSFSVFHGLFVQAFPYPEPERLVHISLMAGGERQAVAWTQMAAWREARRAFDGVFEKMAAFRGDGY